MGKELKLIKTSMEGVFLISSKVFEDSRGSFVKIFQDSKFHVFLDLDFKEIYYSISHQNTIRGMHYQIPPYDHHKLIYVPKGSIVDVVLDLRSESSTFGKHEYFNINENNRNALLIPSGFAHGFLSKEDNSLVCYHQTSEYVAEADSGILWNSFGYDWNIDNPKLSTRDKDFIGFSEFVTKNNSQF